MKGKKFEEELVKYAADEEWMFEGRWFIGRMPRARFNYIVEYGPITDGCDIHHINENKLDDNVDNLIALPPAVHREVHNISRRNERYLRRYEIEPMIQLFNKGLLVTEEISEDNKRRLEKYLDKLPRGLKSHAIAYLKAEAKQVRSKRKSWPKSKRSKRVYHSSPEQAMKNLPRDRVITESVGLKPSKEERKAAWERYIDSEKEMNERLQHYIDKK